MRRLRDDGVVEVRGKVHRTAGVADPQVDPRIVEGLLRTRNQPIRLHDLFFELDDVNRLHGRRGRLEGLRAAEADDQHLFGLGPCRGREQREPGGLVEAQVGDFAPLDARLGEAVGRDPPSLVVLDDGHRRRTADAQVVDLACDTPAGDRRMEQQVLRDR